MQDIDFLPADYRQRTTRQRGGVWRLAAAGALLLVIAGIDISQRVTRHSAEAELAALEQPFLAAQQLKTQLATLDQEIKLAEEDAALMAYLDHRWPVTQLLAAPATETVDSIQLVSIQLQRRAGSTTTRSGFAAGEVSLSNAEAPAVSTSKLTLHELQQISNGELLIVTGTTTDAQAAHRYVTKLGKSPLVKSAKLQSITREGNRGISESTEEKSRFVVHLTVINSLDAAERFHEQLTRSAATERTPL